MPIAVPEGFAGLKSRLELSPLPTPDVASAPAGNHSGRTWQQQAARSGMTEEQTEVAARLGRPADLDPGEGCGPSQVGRAARV